MTTIPAPRGGADDSILHAKERDIAMEVTERVDVSRELLDELLLRIVHGNHLTPAIGDILNRIISDARPIYDLSQKANDPSLISDPPKGGSEERDL